MNLFPKINRVLDNNLQIIILVVGNKSLSYINETQAKLNNKTDLPFCSIKTVSAGRATTCVQQPIHNTDTHTVTRGAHGGAWSPYIHHRVVPVNPVRVIAAAWWVVPTPYCINSALQNCEFLLYYNKLNW